MSNTEIILLASAMFLTGLWLGIFICISVDNHYECKGDLDEKTWERIEGWRK